MYKSVLYNSSLTHKQAFYILACLNMFMDTMHTLFVVFGATGDLMKKKLFPSFYNIYRKNPTVSVLGVGRKELDDESFREMNNTILSSYENKKFQEEVFYQQISYTEQESYVHLKEKIDLLKQEKKNLQVIFYLAMPPHLFNPIMQNLKIQGLDSIEEYQTKIVFEKPFGVDLKSARELNTNILKAFKESQVYRIDHYLGKEAVQNFLTLRFANSFFEPLWNNHYIDNIQITGFETIGIEGRGGYYDESGALKDMLQNHLLQMLSLIAMEPPATLDAKHIRDEKVKVFEAIHHLEKDIEGHIAYGQYSQGVVEGEKVIGYREEEGIPKDSNTETYVALRVFIDNWRWKGVPFYLRTGKRMQKKGTTVVVEFKKLPQLLYNSKDTVDTNKLIIHIQPDASISMEFNVKTPGVSNKVDPVIAEFDHREFFGLDTPEAYEVLFNEIIKGDQSLFARLDGVEEAWRIVDTIVKCRDLREHIELYPSGSLGPKGADKLLEEDGRKWHNL